MDYSKAWCQYWWCACHPRTSPIQRTYLKHFLSISYWVSSWVEETRHQPTVQPTMKRHHHYHIKETGLPGCTTWALVFDFTIYVCISSVYPASLINLYLFFQKFLKALNKLLKEKGNFQRFLKYKALIFSMSRLECVWKQLWVKDIDVFNQFLKFWANNWPNL